MDLVLFHQGHCYAKLMDYRPAKAADVWVFPDRPAPDSREAAIEYAHRRIAEIFKSLIATFPASPWAAQVEQAAPYHEKMAGFMRVQREKQQRANAVREKF
jgi:hypothetical protein